MTLTFTAYAYAVSEYRKRVFTNLMSCIAALLIVPILALSGCTAGQKQTTLQVVTAINSYTPSIVAAADTVAATLAMLAPADAAAIAIGDTAFDTAAKLIQSLAASYIKAPDATILTQLQTAVNTLESQINTATLNAAGIKDAASQRLALAALKGILTAVTIVFGLISQTETTAMLIQLRNTDTIHLAQVRAYMDENQLQVAANDTGMDLNKSFEVAESNGF